MLLARDERRKDKGRQNECYLPPFHDLCFYSMKVFWSSAILAALQAGSPSHAEPLPRWEIGAGMAVLNAPDYRGAEERTTHVLPMPYVIYRGDLIRADREGIRGILFKGERFRLNLSLNGTLPVNDRKNKARRGMEDLRPTVEIGPTLDVALWRAADKRSTLDFRLPLRGGVTVDSPPTYIGWLLYPSLAFSMRSPFAMNGWNMGLVAGSYITDRRYNTHFYSVAPRYVTAERHAYNAHGGYGGSQLTWTLSKRYRNHWIGMFARYDTLRGAVFEASPLVKQRSAFSTGIAISWIFKTSAAFAKEPDEGF